jgi:hypothetical protein
MEAGASLFSAEIQLEKPGGLQVAHVAGEDAHAAHESGSGHKRIFSATRPPRCLFPVDGAAGPMC